MYIYMYVYCMITATPTPEQTPVSVGECPLHISDNYSRQTPRTRRALGVELR
jgi:hypothetical protein